ncbi:MAG: polysaccharide biosynthesis tyrosine autokinase [Bacteroidales bacterium]|nr:polysaccharide biosynthesis tyrosine autokinase [Bacteroidales bacterium]MEE1251681.1 polysaccharide biosynthesis tyrosine autokinase [Bacteroidales bacterium]
MNEEKLSREEDVSSINIMELLYKMLEKWHLFLIAIVVAIIVCIFITKYSTPLYEAKTTLLIKNNSNMMSNLSGNFGFNFYNQDIVNFQNEIGTIQSASMVKRTIKSLDLYVDYFQKSSFKYDDIYKDSPFEIVLDFYNTQPTGIPIDIELIDKNKCLIAYEEQKNVPVYDYLQDKILSEFKDVSTSRTIIRYGQWYIKDGMKFKVILKEPNNWEDELANIKYRFKINDMDALANSFNSTEIELINKESSIISIKFKNSNKHKATDFVNKLCEVYIDMTFEEKNHLNVATIDFVNSQINAISDSLAIAEARKEAFQQSNNTFNLTSDAEYLFEKANEFETKRAEETTKKAYYDYLTNYINQTDLNEGLVAPSTMGVDDPLLSKLVVSLTDLILEKQRLSTTLTPQSPKMKELLGQMETVRNQIKESLKNIQEVSQINENELNRQQNALQLEIDQLPTTHRNMINIERQFKYNDEIYNFLYTKRAEAEIAKNAALPDHKVIDKARFATKVYPRTATNFLLALIIGIAIPAAYILLRYFTKNTIDSKDDLEKLSTAPIIGFIPNFPADSNRLVVFDKPRSQISETFRSLRTNIKYILGNETDEGKIILITSSLPNDGKSLISVNVASIFAISGKKTLLIGYDLRKPSLHKIFGLNATHGLTSYMVGRYELDDVLQATEFNNFDVLVAGPVPPNPSELIDSDKNRALLKELKKRYDYIILDTPPVNLIADAQCLAKESDINLFVVRSEQTNKAAFKISLAELIERNDVKVHFVFNDIKTVAQKYGYGARYDKGYYGYGYGYGYFDNEQVEK